MSLIGLLPCTVYAIAAALRYSHEIVSLGKRNTHNVLSHLLPCVMERMLGYLIKERTLGSHTDRFNKAMLTIFFLIVCLTIAYSIYKRWTRISISQVPGPESKSFLYGKPLFLFST